MPSLRLHDLTVLVLAIALLPGLHSAAAQEAQNCDQATSTPELAACMEGVLKAADIQLNAVFQQAIAQIKKAGHLNTNQRRDWERALREAQRHWIAFTAKDCGEVIGWEWHGGTGQRTATLMCKAQKTRDRTAELKERYSK